MKLKHCIAKVNCSSCNGNKGVYLVDVKYTDDVLRAVEQGKGVWQPCKDCNGTGVIKGVVLAPVGYDGVSEVDWPNGEIRTVSLYNQPHAFIHGHCKDCKYCKGIPVVGDSAECVNEKVHYQAEKYFMGDFGCIHWEGR